MRRDAYDCDICKGKDVDGVVTINKQDRTIHLCEKCSREHITEDLFIRLKGRARDTF